ncbi:MAG: lipopolysaccharide transport periplasmic protein LptA [Burkholderiales bacterium]|nr:lipopolysaccharide transport periplasmic protein LptA [Burkholderiales bacterium]
MNYWQAALIACTLSVAGAPALAERADRDKPVNIEADRMSYDDLRQINIFEGKVVLTQGTLVIRADKITVRQSPEGFQSGTAEKGQGGLAYFRQKREGLDEYVEGWGERIDYDTRTEKAVLTTRARILRGADEVRGNLITYDGRTEFFDVTGSRDSATSNNPDGRVRAVIQPRNQGAPGDASPGKPPPLNLRPSGGIVAPREEYPRPGAK